MHWDLLLFLLFPVNCITTVITSWIRRNLFVHTYSAIRYNHKVPLSLRIGIYVYTLAEFTPQYKNFCKQVHKFYLYIVSTCCKHDVISKVGESCGIVISIIGLPSLSRPPGMQTIRSCNSLISGLVSIFVLSESRNVTVISFPARLRNCLVTLTEPFTLKIYIRKNIDQCYKIHAGNHV